MQGQILITLVLWQLSPSKAASDDRLQRPVELGSRPPLVAVWCDDIGWQSQGAPFLRIAIWEDGRVLSARNPRKWEHHLMEGKISAERVMELKKRVADTGIFDLKVTSGLVPDASVYRILVNIDGKRKRLSWDEVELARYGINIDPTPDNLKFKNCWKAVNRLALESRPSQTTPVVGRFARVPLSWMERRAKPPK